jgi:hypothetical protein
MYKDLKFPILIVHRAIKADSVAGERIRGIAEELSQDGFAIIKAADHTEARLVATTPPWPGLHADRRRGRRRQHPPAAEHGRADTPGPAACARPADLRPG